MFSAFLIMGRSNTVLIICRFRYENVIRLKTFWHYENKLTHGWRDVKSLRHSSRRPRWVVVGETVWYLCLSFLARAFHQTRLCLLVFFYTKCLRNLMMHCEQRQRCWTLLDAVGSFWFLMHRSASSGNRGTNATQNSFASANQSVTLISDH